MYWGCRYQAESGNSGNRNQLPQSLQSRQNIQLKKPLLKIHKFGFIAKRCIALSVPINFVGAVDVAPEALVPL